MLFLLVISMVFNFSMASDDPSDMARTVKTISGGNVAIIDHESRGGKIADLVRENHQSYAKHHEYDYVSPDGSSVDTVVKARMPMNWVKVPLMKKTLQNHNWVLWVDMDAIFVNKSMSIQDALISGLSDRITSGSIPKMFFSGDTNAINSGNKKILVH